MDVLILLLLVFLAGVGLGTFVLGARIRKIVADTVLHIRNAEAEVYDVTAKAEQRIAEFKKAL